MNENIYLIGFMGSGKTTLGKVLAERLSYQWIDVDDYIEKSQKATIKDLFSQYGEQYFRDLETKSLKKLADEKFVVVSTGGGIVVTPKNREFLQRQNTFYLKWHFETLYKRVCDDSNRPLVRSYQQLLELYQSREMLYETACSKVIDAEKKTIHEITKEIVNLLEG